MRTHLLEYVRDFRLAGGTRHRTIGRAHRFESVSVTARGVNRAVVAIRVAVSAMISLVVLLIFAFGYVVVPSNSARPSGPDGIPAWGLVLGNIHKEDVGVVLGDFHLMVVVLVDRVDRDIRRRSLDLPEDLVKHLLDDFFAARMESLFHICACFALDGLQKWLELVKMLQRLGLDQLGD